MISFIISNVYIKGVFLPSCWVSIGVKLQCKLKIDDKKKYIKYESNKNHESSF